MSSNIPSTTASTLYNSSAAILRNVGVDGQPPHGSPRSARANTDEKDLSTERQKPTIAVPAVHFSSADKELLDSGKYADANIVANGKTYGVHKSVLCTRSKWFRRALDGAFREGQEGAVEISAPDNIERVLEFLYTGAVDLSNDADLMIAANELSVLGDFYLIDEMKQYASQVLGQYLGEILNAVCEVSNWLTMDNFEFLRNRGFIDRLCAAIRDAYATPSGIHRVYVDFVYAARIHTFRNPLIQALSDDIPEFGRDVLTALMTGPQSSAFEGNTAFEQWKDGVTSPEAARYMNSVSWKSANPYGLPLQGLEMQPP